MATDRHGNPITEEMFQGMKQFTQNETPRKLCYEASTYIQFRIDDTYYKQQKPDTDDEIYETILPSPLRNTPISLIEGETITLAKQYGHLNACVDKNFRIAKIKKGVRQDTNQLVFYTIVNVIPLYDEEPE